MEEALDNQLQNCLKKGNKRWEELCIRCGGCCGAYDDPCQHLKKDPQSGFYCEIYSQRFGTQKTLGGEEFDCVFVKEIINSHWPNEHLCIYKKYLKTPWLLNVKTE